ncbi:MAG: flagellar motor switch protein FliM [Firmicutes bacterium]|nr:flagellar motor switch protein FliM [Bacillota bacterium]
MSEERVYRKYDFYSPRKFTKDHIRMLNSIFDDYSRMVNSRINALLHANCEIGVATILEQRYYEFSNSLNESDVLSLIKLNTSQVQEDTPILFHIETPLSLSMVDRLAGGEGDPDYYLPPNYKMTDLELLMMETIVTDLISVMGESWGNYLPLDFEYIRKELNPTLVQLIGYDETVVVVELSARFTNIEGKIRVCLPGGMLSNLFALINENTVHHPSGEDKSEDIFDSLRDSELEIVAELARTQLLLSDIYNLNVGDVVDMKKPKDSEVYLNIGGRRWFNGKMGVHNKQMAVRVGEIYYKE